MKTPSGSPLSTWEGAVSRLLDGSSLAYLPISRAPAGREARGLPQIQLTRGPAGHFPSLAVVIETDIQIHKCIRLPVSKN